MKKAESVPDLSATWMSAVRATAVSRGSTTMRVAPRSWPPDVLGQHGEALADVGSREQEAVGEQDVGEGVARPVDVEGELVGPGGTDHAEPAVVVDVPGLQRHPGELADQVGLLGEEARPAEYAEGVPPVLLLDAPDLGDGEVECLVPGDLPQFLVARAAHEGAVSRSGWLTCW